MKNACIFKYNYYKFKYYEFIRKVTTSCYKIRLLYINSLFSIC